MSVMLFTAQGETATAGCKSLDSAVSGNRFNPITMYNMYNASLYFGINYVISQSLVFLSIEMELIILPMPTS